MNAIASDIAAGISLNLPKVDAGALLQVGTLLSGVGLLSYGAWLAWHPAGFMLAGALLVYGVIQHQRGSAARTARGR